MIKIATFNANSIRSRLEITLDWLEKENPDVLALQECKAQDSDFPWAAFESKGWKVCYRGQKSYNGVAFISRESLELVSNRLYPNDPEEDARFLHCKFKGISLINTYVPQGYLIDSPKYQKKLKFFTDLKKYFEDQFNDHTPALWMGDLNVAPTEIDLARPTENEDHVCYHIDARKALENTSQPLWKDLFRLKESGPGNYTFWDYRHPKTVERNLGWRIDHILGTKPMCDRLEKIWIDKAPRLLEKPSDHTFLVAQFQS